MTTRRVKCFGAAIAEAHVSGGEISQQPLDVSVLTGTKPFETILAFGIEHSPFLWHRRVLSTPLQTISKCHHRLMPENALNVNVMLSGNYAPILP